MEAALDKLYRWEDTQVGDTAPAYYYEMTAEKIVAYCRAARYENVAYTSQAAAKEAGLPGMIAPPAMVFTYAPICLSGLASTKGRSLPEDSALLAQTGHPVKTSIGFQGAMVLPGDFVRSVTSIQDKYQQEGRAMIVLRVEAHNQRKERVAEYTCACLWPLGPDSQGS